MVPAVLPQRGIARTLELVGLQVPLPRTRSTGRPARARGPAPSQCLLTRPAAPRAQVRSRARLGQPLGRVTSIVFELRDTSIVKLIYGPGRCPQDALGGAQAAANSRA